MLRSDKTIKTGVLKGAGYLIIQSFFILNINCVIAGDFSNEFLSPIVKVNSEVVQHAFIASDIDAFSLSQEQRSVTAEDKDLSPRQLIQKYSYKIKMNKSFEANVRPEEVGEGRSFLVNESPYYPGVPLGGFGTVCFTPASNGKIGSSFFNPDTFNPASVALPWNNQQAEGPKNTKLLIKETKIFDNGNFNMAHYDYVEITVQSATPGTKIKVQLLDDKRDISTGFSSTSYELSGKEEVIKVPLNTLKGVDIKNITQVRVHYGQRDGAGAVLNDDDNQELLISKLRARTNNSLYLFYKESAQTQEIEPLNAGTHSMLYPKSSYNFHSDDDSSAKLSVTQFSPIIPHDYKTTSYPVSVFRITADNTTSQKTSVTMHIPLENFINIAGWDPQDVTTRVVFEKDKTGMMLFVPGQKGQIALGVKKEEGIEIEYAKPELEGSSLGTLKVKIAIDAAQTRDVPVVLSADFPEAAFAEGKVIKQRYYTRFFGKEATNAWEMVGLGIDKAEEWEAAIDAWMANILKLPGIPYELKQNALNALGYLVNGGTVWDAKTGLFSYLEGLDYPMYNTLDVLFFGAAPLLELWPEIFKNIMLAFGETVLQEDATMVRYDHAFPIEFIGRKKPRGAVPHDLGGGYGDFAPNYYKHQNSSLWKDLNPKFVMMAYQYYAVSGKKDKEFLENIWQPVFEAIEYMKQFGKEETGYLPEHGAFADWTYDRVPIKGFGAYTGGLWIGALEAALEMAKQLNKPEMEYAYQTWLTRARAEYEKLWNGRYYTVDAQTEGVILADQLAAQLIADHAGLPSIVPAEEKEKRIKSILKTIYENNVLKAAKKAGNAELPRGAVNTFHETKGFIGEIDDLFERMNHEVWTGVQYAIIDLMLRYGLEKEGAELSKMIYKAAEDFGVTIRWPEAWMYNSQIRPCGNGYMRFGAVWFPIITALHKNKKVKVRSVVDMGGISDGGKESQASLVESAI
ncbi:MAG: hypothetical protein GY853_06415 [PVC group bacterium]|nr:hypothetical protein [PVC group bacterium]